MKGIHWLTSLSYMWPCPQMYMCAVGAPATHLLAATAMNAPIAISISKLLFPDARRTPDEASSEMLARTSSVELRVRVEPRVPTGSAHGEGDLEDGRVHSTARGAAVELGRGCGSVPDGREPLAVAAASASGAMIDVDAPRIEGTNVATADEAGGSRTTGTTTGGTADVSLSSESEYDNVVQAAAGGAMNAVTLVACIAATLIAFLATIHLLDSVIGWAGSLIGIHGLSFTRLLGFVGWPVALLMGVPPADCALVGQLLGTKTAANEFVAYSRLADLIHTGQISNRAAVIATCVSRPQSRSFWDVPSPCPFPVPFLLIQMWPDRLRAGMHCVALPTSAPLASWLVGCQL